MQRVENSTRRRFTQANQGDVPIPPPGRVCWILCNSEGSARPESGSLYFKYNMFDSKMEHYHYDSFKTEFADFYLQMTQLATFTLGDDGKVAGFQIEVMGLLILFTKVTAPAA